MTLISGLCNLWQWGPVNRLWFRSTIVWKWIYSHQYRTQNPCLRAIKAR